ncbi:MAG: hypothetical protein ABL865_08215 [Candidatus Nitrotoga sp.]
MLCVPKEALIYCAVSTSYNGFVKSCERSMAAENTSGSTSETSKGQVDCANLC